MTPASAYQYGRYVSSIRLRRIFCSFVHLSPRIVCIWPYRLHDTMYNLLYRPHDNVGMVLLLLAYAIALTHGNAGRIFDGARCIWGRVLRPYHCISDIVFFRYWHKACIYHDMQYLAPHLELKCVAPTFRTLYLDAPEYDQ